MAGLIATFVIYDRLTPMSGKLAKSRYEMGTALIGLTVPVDDFAGEVFVEEFADRFDGFPSRRLSNVR